MEVRMESARLLTYKAAMYKDEGLPHTKVVSSLQDILHDPISILFCEPQ